MGKLYDSLPDSFMKKVLKDENSELVENLLAVKMQFEKEQDRDRKVVFRDRLASAFGNVYVEIGRRLTDSTSKEKRLCLRYGLLDLKYLSEEDQKLVLSQPLDENDPEETCFYVDEWLLQILKGRVKPSMTDEASPRQAKGSQDGGQQAKYERLSGLVEAEKKNYTTASERRRMQEEAILSLIQMITNHPLDPTLNAPENYNEEQLKKMEDIADTVREMRKSDKEMAVSKRSYYEKYEELRDLENDAADNQKMPTEYAVDAKTAENEISSIRQMTKMCIGRQGNHFPILLSSFMPKETKEYNFKSIAYKKLKEVEELDPSIFTRTFRQNTHRIPPYIILTPGYGNFGMCWEPYDRYNKATSKGRLALPIFCKNPKMAIAVALGDFRWQVAKEMAGYHWMDEGLTARYYEYLTSAKIKGDIKSHFVNDYILWITKEAEGIQKLDSQAARYIFWRFVPFPDKLKEELSNRGFYYNDLYKKELSFKMSQGH